MRTKALVIFLAFILFLTVGLVLVLESKPFARFVKRTALTYLPKNLGLEVDFKSFSLKMFPPGIAIDHPICRVVDKNPAKLPLGTEVRAESLQFSFEPFQAISGRVTVDEVRVVDGFFSTTIEPTEEKQKKKTSLSWESLLSVNIQSALLINTKVKLKIPSLRSELEFLGKRVLAYKSIQNRVEFLGAETEIENIKISAPKSWKYATSLDQVALQAKIFEDALLVEHIQISKLNSSLVAEGALEGDLLQAKNLQASLKLNVDTESNEFLDFVGVGEDVRKNLSGKVNFSGEASLDPNSPAETLMAKGTLTARGLEAYRFQVDRLRIDGKYSAKTKEVKVAKLIAETRDTPRVLGLKPSAGGKIEISSFEVSPNSISSFTLPIRFENARVNWLFSPIIETMYPLDGAVSGALLATIQLPKNQKSLSIQGDANLSIQNLLVDNQKLGIRKPHLKVLSMPRLEVKGPVSLVGDKLSFHKVRLRSKKTDLTAEGMIELKKRGVFNLLGTGPFDFADLDVLADQKFKGSGDIGISVKGPSDAIRIKVSPDLTGAEFLNFKFGRIFGDVVWVDAESRLDFERVGFQRGRTSGVLQGTLRAGAGVAENQRLDLKVRIPQGSQSDFYEIVEHYLKDFWWYPASAKAWLQGYFEISGGLALNQMAIHAELQGQNIEWMKERFPSFYMKGGYRQGTYHVSTAKLEKGSSSIEGSFSLSPNQQIQWSVSGEQLLLGDFERIARFDLPIRGQISFRSDGNGKLSEALSETFVKVSGLSVLGRNVPDSAMTLKTHAQGFDMSGYLQQDRCQFLWKQDKGALSPSAVDVLAQNLDLTPLLLVIQPDLQKATNLSALVSFQLSHKFLGDEWQMGTGFLNLAQLSIHKNEYFLDLEKPVRMTLEKGIQSKPVDMTLLQKQGVIRILSQLNKGNLESSLSGKLDLGILELFVKAIERTQGAPTIELSALGPISAPRVAGEIKLRGEQVKLKALEGPFESISGLLVLDNKGVNVRDVESVFSGGRVTAQGRVNWLGFSAPELDLKSQIFGSRLKVFPFQFIKVRGGITLKGNRLPYLAEGSVIVENGLSRERLSQTRAASAKTLKYAPLPKESLSETPLMALDIKAISPGNLIVKNEFLDIEAKGEMSLQGTLDQPYPIGRGSAVQGKILFKDQVFQIQSGVMDFDTVGVVNPKFEVVSQTEIANRRIQMLAAGRLDNYKIEFTSNPALPESEILSLLTLGVTRSDQEKRRQSDRSTVEQGEAASLVLHSLDFNREVADKTGLQIGVDEAVNNISGQSIFRPRNDVDNNAATAPKIVIRRQIGKRVGVSVGSTVGVGASIQRNVKAEVKVNERFSVLGAWDTFEGQTSDLNRRNSYGVDLKLQRRFK